MSVNIASKIPFSDLCKLYEKLSAAKRESKYDILVKYIKYFRDFGERLKAEKPDAEVSFFPVLRLLVPQQDRSRSSLGVRGSMLAQLVVRLLCLPRDGPDARRLLHFREPGTGGAAAGDIAEAAYWLLRKYWGDSGDGGAARGTTLTVEAVNEQLDAIAECGASNDRCKAHERAGMLLRAGTGMERRWLLRLLLRELRLGLSVRTVLSAALGPAAHKRLDTCADLQQVCQEAELGLLTSEGREAGGRGEAEEMGIALFSPFRPMLAAMCSADKLPALFERRPHWWLEPKHDGERFQLHFANGIFKYFSRNGRDYTSRLGPSAAEGSLSPRVFPLLQLGLASCILDGELMAWDTAAAGFRAKGDAGVDPKVLQGDGVLRPCFCAFDILWLDGRPLAALSYEARVKLLETTLPGAAEGAAVQLTPRRLLDSATAAQDALDAAMDAQAEGIVLKSSTDPYTPNARNSGWLKVKPDYSDGLLEHIDCVIMGGYYGGGRRSGIISHFLIGLVDIGSDGTAVGVQSLARVGSGYTLSRLQEVVAKLELHWQRPPPPPATPPRLVWGRERPDVFIDPQHSIVLEIKATEIMSSSRGQFAMPWTLRFPRVECVRDDKNWIDATSIADFDALRQSTSGKLCGRRAGDSTWVGAGGAGGRPSKQRQGRQRRGKAGGREEEEGAAGAPAARALPRLFAPADLSSIVRKSGVFTGRELCILSDHLSKGKLLTKQQLEELVAQHGGTLVQNPDARTWVAVSSRASARARNAQGTVDVATTHWLLRCITRAPAHALPPTHPRDLLLPSPATAAALRRRFDAFGDAFTAPATPASLRRALQQARPSLPSLPRHHVADLDQQLFHGPSPFSPLRFCNAHFHPPPTANTLLDGAKAAFRFLGGCEHPTIQHDTTHIIINSRDLSWERQLQELIACHPQRLLIVTERWVAEQMAQAYAQVLAEVAACSSSSSDSSDTSDYDAASFTECPIP